MALILKNGAVFLHIPKTGGNWVTRILEELDLIDTEVPHKHADVCHFFSQWSKQGRGIFGGRLGRDRSQAKQDKPFMFCFVRNPLSWYES